jgi:hypothetical protein
MTVVLGSIGWGLIAVGALTHTWHHDRLRDLLGRHLDADRAAAAILVFVEVLLTLSIAVGVIIDPSWLPTVAVAGGVLGLGFVAWISRLLLTGSELPCACSFSSAPTSAWSLARAVAVLAVSVLAIADAGSLAVAERIGALAVGLGAAAAIYVLPEALGWPEFSRAQLARLDSHAPARNTPKPS